MSDLSEILKPGDIINTSGVHWSKDIIDVSEGIIATGAITRTQKSIFCKRLSPQHVRCRDSHSMIYFAPDGIFSVQMPEAKYVNLSDHEGNDTRTVSVYRMNSKYFGLEIGPADAAIMKKAADEIIEKHCPYDIGQLLDILCNTVAGYPYAENSKLFDQGQDRIVCSVGCASIIAAWRHEVKEKTGKNIPRPWARLNPPAWDKKMLENYQGFWDVQVTFPALFAVTDTHFSSEFILVGQFKGGKKIA
jgi:hypothetical protein